MRKNCVFKALVPTVVLIVGICNQVFAQEETASDVTVAHQDSYGFENEVELGIIQALARKMDFVFDDCPFADVLTKLQSDVAIPVVLMDSAVDAGLSEDELIDMQLLNLSMGAGLKIMLDKFDCTYVMQDEVLKILSSDEAEGPSFFVRRIYDISDLQTASISELPNAIMTSISPDSWDDNGGTGSVVPLNVNGRNLLLVNHRWNEQALVAGFLRGLRRSVEGKPAVAAQEEQIDLNVYVVPEALNTEAAEITAMVQQSLSGVDWEKSPEHYLKSYGNIIVAKNSRGSLAKIDELMRRIGVKPSSTPGGFGGGAKGGGVFNVLNK